MGNRKKTNIEEIGYKSFIWQLEKEAKITQCKLDLWKAIDQLFCFAYEADEDETRVSKKQFDEGYIALSEYLTMLDDIAQQKDGSPDMGYIFYLYAVYLEIANLK